MKRLAIALGAAVSVTADCTSAGLAAYTDPYFNWLITGTNAQRESNVTAICASADNTARTNFNARLNEVATACVPAGTDFDTSAFGIMISLLNKVICEQKQVRYCILSLLPLFDMNYFLSLSQGNFQIPPLSAVAGSADRQAALCASNICSSYIENIVPGLLTNLPSSAAATIAAEFIRGTVSRMRCGCTGKVNPCYSTKVTADLINNGSLVETNACDASGLPTECARTWITCENVPPPKCEKPCTKKNIATIGFVLGNLNYDCLNTAANLLLLKSDVMANVPGLLKDDFECVCGASVAPKTGTTCTCNVTCGNLGKILSLADKFAALQARATALVVATPTLDKLLSTCKVNPDSASFGSSFEVTAATLNTDDDAANANGALGRAGAIGAFAVAIASTFVF